MRINEIINLMLNNELWMNNSINLVSSENQMSSYAKLALMSDSYNRYFFNPDINSKFWNFQGCKSIHEIETRICIPVLQRLACAKYVNIRPLSGLSCMMLILNALGGNPGSRIMSVSPMQGGHYATEDLAKSFGLIVDFIPGIDGQSFDYKRLSIMVNSNNYSLIYIDQSYCLFPIDLEKVVKIVKSANKKTLIHVDASHTMGLVLGGAHANPLKLGADSFGGSTHKTFPGPQKGIFCTNSKQLADIVKENQFFMISHHHFGEVLSLGISLCEFEECGGKNYAKQVIINAKCFAECLANYGYDVKYKERGFTETHQIWMSTSNIGIDTYEASMRLYDRGIITNVLYDLPMIDEATFRFGINEFTWLGAYKQEVEELVNIIDAIIRGKNTEQINARVKSLKMRLNKPYCYKDKSVLSSVNNFINTSLYDIFGEN